MYVHMQRGDTPLHKAAKYGQITLISMLIEAGVSDDVKNKVTMYC